MIESIEFTHFKALRQSTLALNPFTLLLGPNGSGKSTVLHALKLVASVARGALDAVGGTREVGQAPYMALKSVTASTADNGPIAINLRMLIQGKRLQAQFKINHNNRVERTLTPEHEDDLRKVGVPCLEWLAGMQVFALDPTMVAKPAMVSARPITESGDGLAAVLDDMKDSEPERWDRLLAELRNWLPEYDSILFDKPKDGQKALALRTKKGGYRISARDLSQGTLIALAILTLAYMPKPPTLVGLEEIERGVHPRLLRHLQDALYRLSYPDSCAESRPPIQVVATSHSPYLLDLFRDHPEEVVLAQKAGLEVTMRRLSDTDHFSEILGNAPLSELWYSGVFGGVAVKS